MFSAADGRTIGVVYLEREPTTVTGISEDAGARAVWWVFRHKAEGTISQMDKLATQGTRLTPKFNNACNFPYVAEWPVRVLLL